MSRILTENSPRLPAVASASGAPRRSSKHENEIHGKDSHRCLSKRAAYQSARQSKSFAAAIRNAHSLHQTAPPLDLGSRWRRGDVARGQDDALFILSRAKSSWRAFDGFAFEGELDRRCQGGEEYTASLKAGSVSQSWRKLQKYPIFTVSHTMSSAESR